MSEELPTQQTNRTDYATSLAKGIFGAIPFVGPIAAEIIGHVIPDQRADRITRFFELLEERVSHLEQNKFRQRCLQPDAVDLIEDALFQAARAKSQDRLEYIADIIANGLTDDEQKQEESNKMLWFLDKLTDVEIILLRGSLCQTREDSLADAEYREKHSVILSPRHTYVKSSREVIEESAIYTSYKQHLAELGLLRPNFKRFKKDELPEFDTKTGMVKSSGHTITLLGKMFLRYLNLIPEWAEKN